MAEVNEAQLDKLVKAGNNQAACAKALGLTPGQLHMLVFGRSLVRTGQLANAPATEASVKKLRAAGTRWEYISAQTGLSVAKVKEICGEAPKPKAAAKNGGSKAKAAAPPKAGRGRGRPPKAAAPAGRARTRAERAARSGNPS